MTAVCDICGKKFKNQFALKGHKKMKNDAEHRAWREKNIDANDRPEIQKSAVQTGMYSPEVLEKVKEFVEKRRRDEIIDEYFKNAIQPMFDNGSWLDNNKHFSILAKKDEDHKLEISAITASHQREKEDLEHQIEYQGIEINNLKGQILGLNGFINEKLDIEIRNGQDKLKYDREVFYAEKVDFARYKTAEESKLDKSKSDLERIQTIVETRENLVAVGEDSLKKQKENFARNTERVDNALEEKTKNVNSREYNLIESEKVFQKLAYETGEEFDLKRKRIKDSKEKCERELKNKEDKQVDKKKDDEEKITKEWEKINKIKKEQKAKGQRLQKKETRLLTNRIFNIIPSPNTYCEAPNLFNGADHSANQNDRGTFRNDLPLEGKSNDIYRAIPVVYPVSSSGVLILQSGNSPPLISSDEVKTIENSGTPVLQSGYSTCYFGTGNFNKK